MSRRIIPTFLDRQTAVVGWDNPLQTFFAQVTDNAGSPEDDPSLLWVGSGPGDVQDPAGLRRPLAPYADLTDDMIRRLAADRAACGGRPPTHLQRNLVTLLRRSSG